MRRIKAKNIYDFELKDYFATYTQTLLDLALSDDYYLENDDNPTIHKFAELNAKRISLFRQTNLFKIYQNFLKFMSFEIRKGINMMTLENNVRRLRLEQDLEPDIVKKIYYDFYQFLSNGTGSSSNNHDTIIRFLFLFPRYKGGLQLLGNGLFSCEPEVRYYTKECLKVIKTSKVGKKYIAQLNFMILSKFVN